MKLFLKFLCFTIVLSTVTTAAVDNQLPDDVPKCSRDDVNINECMKNVLQMMLPRLKNGNKDLNIPPIDPFHLAKSTYQYSNGAINGGITIKNTKILGLSETIIKDADVSIEDMRMKFNTVIPKIFVDGLYKAQIKINDLALSPKGYFNISMENIAANITERFESFEKDGTRFIRAANFDISPKFGDMKIYASGIFPDPALNEIALQFINQNWRSIMKSILPVSRDYYEPLLILITNEFLGKYSYDVLLPKMQN